MRVMSTPSRHSEPPTNMSGVGTSPRISHDSRIARAGTKFVVAEVFPC